MYLKNPGPGFRHDRELPLDCFPLGGQHWHSHPRCWPGGHQLLQATSYLLTNHRGKRLNGSNGFEMLPLIYFPCRNFFFSLEPLPPLNFSQCVFTMPGARMGGYYSEPKVHRGEGEDTSSKKKGIEAIRESGKRGKRQRENLGRI